MTPEQTTVRASAERSAFIEPAPQLRADAPVLQIDGVHFVRHGRTILDDVSLTVHAGEHWALIGANGAGKSTLLSFCGAMAHPTRGRVSVLGATLGRVELQALRRSIGHVNPRHGLRAPLPITDVVLTGLTGSEELPLRWSPTDEQLAEAHRLVALLGLGGKADEHWTTLSQGERGRTLIARALIAEPALLLLDEPSTGLDVAAREQLLDTLDLLRDAHPEVASVLVTHHLEELPESTSHALLLAEGRVTASGPADAVLTTDEVTRAFAHPISVERRDGRWSARAGRAARGSSEPSSGPRVDLAPVAPTG